MKLPTPSLEHFKTIDLKSFGVGLGVVAALYLLIFAYIMASARSTIEGLEKRLSSHSVAISEDEISLDATLAAPNVNAQNKEQKIPLIEGLSEETDIGPLPIVRKSDGLTSFRAYQNTFDFSVAADKPAIIFAVKDFGLSAETSRTALEILPPEVGFILSPYSVMPDEWISLAREGGHEVWMHTPIQTKDLAHNDSGAATIMTNASYVAKLSALHWSMSRGHGYIGVSSYSDDMILSSKEHFSSLSDEIYGRGLGYFELNPNATSFIESKAISKDAPYIKADMKILHMRGADDSFEALEDRLAGQGLVVAIVPNTPNQIKNLAAWILKIGQADYTITPASALYDMAVQRGQSDATDNAQESPLAPQDLEPVTQEPKE